MANGNKSKRDDAAGGDGRSGDFLHRRAGTDELGLLNVRFTHGTADTLQASWVAENQLAEAQLTRTDFPDAEQQGTEIMGGRSWNWRKQRVKTADNVWANTLRVYAESDESQPVISLRIIPPGESK